MCARPHTLFFLTMGMRKTLLILALVAFAVSLTNAQVTIIPKPVSVNLLSGIKKWENNIIIVSDKSTSDISEVFNQSLTAKGFTPVIATKTKSKNVVELKLTKDNS